ncbi:HtaA domain-containing protein [Streptomyces sp. NPDC059893]|uniref:HtaA domain-containing protein n=1 Tax=Streptomyces sp. NPDC059893 TaxID=3346990 RepID=UPI003658E30B
MSRAPHRGVLRWAVKTSFVHYVTTIAAGTCEVSDGAELDADGVFQFPLAEASEGADGWTLRFGGAAHFFAHRGFLDVELRGLALTLPAGGRGSALGVAAANGEHIALASVASAVPAPGNGVLRWSQLVPSLTEAGSELFGTVYPAGSDLAPLDVVVLLDS